MVDSAKPRDTFVLKRGAYDNPGEKVTPGVPAVLPPLRPEWPKNRLGLARSPAGGSTADGMISRTGVRRSAREELTRSSCH